MEQILKDKVDLFVDNVNYMKKYTRWEHGLYKMLSALLYANEGRIADGEAVLHGKDIIKSNTGLFSQFKGNARIVVATQLALSSQPEELFQKSLKVYQMMKEEGFSASDFLTIATVMIASQKEEYDYKVTVKRSKEFYDCMKKEHFFLTGRDDYIFVTMLGMTDLNVRETADHIEEFYTEFKKHFFTSNGVQALSQILVLSEEPKEILTQKVLMSYEAFSQRGYRLKSEYVLPMLGIISLLSKDIDPIVRDIIDTHEYLKEQRGFGSFSLTMKERMMFAIALVSSSYLDGAKKNAINTSLSTSITNIIIAQQSAIIAASAASAAAAASSSSN